MTEIFVNKNSSAQVHRAMIRTVAVKPASAYDKLAVV
jgi:hypothetical protein